VITALILQSLLLLLMQYLKTGFTQKFQQIISLVIGRHHKLKASVLKSHLPAIPAKRQHKKR
jgi:hypothetical protein